MGRPRPADSRGRGPGPNIVDPAWSPDGKRLVVAIANRRRSAGPLGLAVVSPGGALRRITSPEPAERDTSPDWSPDGRWLVADRSTGGVGGRDVVYVVRSNGTGARRVTPLRRVLHSVEGSDPSWTPDGRILYVTYGGPKDSEARLTVENADGGGRRVVLRLPSRRGIHGPTWQPG